MPHRPHRAPKFPREFREIRESRRIGVRRSAWLLALVLTGIAAAPRVVPAEDEPPSAATPERPFLRKLGTIDCDMVETTPVVFQGRALRFEYVRPGYLPNKTGDSYFRFVDLKTGEATPSFAKGYDLGCARVEGGTMYVFGADHWAGSRIQVFRSTDLETWTDETALRVPEGWEIFNCSVCEGAGGEGGGEGTGGEKDYVMAFEVGAPPEVVGVAFTTFFATSRDLVHWELLPLDRVYTKERYSACPTIRRLDGFYYMTYLEARPGPSWETWIVRSRDLIAWESSPLNPVMAASPEDKTIRAPGLDADQRARIAAAVDRNNSDFDLCEIDGKVRVTYSWGNQEGNEFLAEAEYDGTLAEFLRGWFP